MMNINIIKNFRGIRLSKSKIEELVKVILNRFDRGKKKKYNYQISIVIADKSHTLAINKEFLNSSKDTDVISFDLSEDVGEEEGNCRSFEIIVNGEKAVEEAKSRGHSISAEVALYITHGLLHNLGFDDQSERDAKKMHETEDEILQHAGFGLVYNSGKQSPV
jgi:rRNA maturation RNase YbeY